MPLDVFNLVGSELVVPTAELAAHGAFTRHVTFFQCQLLTIRSQVRVYGTPALSYFVKYGELGWWTGLKVELGQG